jgi:multimeric flavodoxin WrbA
MSTEVKILGIAWSPRHGNTEIMVDEALQAAGQLPGVTTEFYSVAGKKIFPCKVKDPCWEKPDPEKLCWCYKHDADAFHEIVQLVSEADGIIWGAPVYWMSVPSEMQAFFDRSRTIEALGWKWRNKVAGFLTVAWDRNGGQETAIQRMRTWATMHDFLVVGVGPERPEISIGGYLGAMGIQGFPFPKESLEAVREDTSAMFASKCVGWRVAEMAKIVKAGYATVPREETKWHKGAIELTPAPQEA